MKPTLQRLLPPLVFKENSFQYSISANMAKFIYFLPFVILGSLFLLGVLHDTPDIKSSWFYWLLKENHPVELLTFVFLMLASYRAILLARQQGGRKKEALLFYSSFAFLALFVAMEEIAWGQQFFGFQTPSLFNAINAQKEVTVHNIHILQGHSEVFRLGFGIAGLIGVSLASVPWFNEIHPPRILITWFVVITGHATLDLYEDYFPLLGSSERDLIFSELSEAVEMLIAIVAYLYILLNERKHKLPTQ